MPLKVRTLHLAPSRRARLTALVLPLLAVTACLALSGCEQVGTSCTGQLPSISRHTYLADWKLAHTPARFDRMTHARQVHLLTYLASIKRFTEGSVEKDTHGQSLICHGGVWVLKSAYDQSLASQNTTTTSGPTATSTTSTSSTVPNTTSTSTSTTSTSTTSTSTTSTSTTTTTLPPTCIQSCDGAELTATVNRQSNGVWGYITGTGLQPGATISLCNNLTGCNPYTTVSGGGTFSVGPVFCCDAARSSFYAITTTAAHGMTITSNSVSH